MVSAQVALVFKLNAGGVYTHFRRVALLVSFLFYFA